MVLTVGTRLGPYEILGPLGAGGMGEVYRAKDSKLGREVAIKILPDSLTHDHERLARFEREARVLATLNHSNIAQIYAVEQDALVMELVAGETLKGPLPLETALEYAKQIAGALEAAHEKGIVHRDLKPSNIMITPSGVAKVLDFGLAVFAQGEGGTTGNLSNSPTLPISPTLSGVILGTAAYMAPEQARGQVVDRRADVWAFGAVLYEMLTGCRAFGGETVSDILAAVLKSEPDYSLLPENLPPRVEYLLKRCLKKRLTERLRDIGEARIWIEEIEDQRAMIAGSVAAPPASRRSTTLFALAALVAGLLLGALIWWTVSPRGTSNWTGTFLGGPSNALGPRISPDGKTLAFQAMVDGLLQVAVMKPESGNWTVLTHEREQGSVQEITWSPDGTKLFFSRTMGNPRGIYSVPVLGGAERLVLEASASPEMLSDGSLLVLKINAKRQFQIHHFWPESGKLEPLPAAVAVTDISTPLRAFPDGKEAAYIGSRLTGDQSDRSMLYALDLQTGKSRIISPGLMIQAPPEGTGFPMAITPDGKKVLVGVMDGDLRKIIAVPRTGNAAPETWFSSTQNVWYLDAGPDGSIYVDQLLEQQEALRFPVSGGRPEVLVRGLALGPVLQRGDGTLLVSAIFAGRSRVATLQPAGGGLTPVSDTREEVGLSITKAGEGAVAFPLGPQGKTVIALASLPDGRIVRRLLPKGATIKDLASSPDGSRIFYVSDHDVWSMPADGGDAVRIGEGDSVAASTEDAVVKLNANDGFYLMRVPLAGGKPVNIPSSPTAAFTSGALSPLAIGSGGRIVMQVNVPHMWFYRVATIERNSSRLDLIPIDYDGDIWFPGWTPDGRIVATGLQYHFSLWQMHH